MTSHDKISDGKSSLSYVSVVLKEPAYCVVCFKDVSDLKDCLDYCDQWSLTLFEHKPGVGLGTFDGHVQIIF